MRIVRKGKTVRVAAGLLLAALAGLAVYLMAAGAAPGRPHAAPRAKVTIATVYDLAATPVNIAWIKGFFEDGGLDADVRFYPSGRHCLEAVLGGEADFGTVAETPIVFAGLQGKAFAILATIGTTEKGTFVIARKDRGIREPADLAGKRVGVPRGTSAHFLLDSLLLLNGVEPGRVTPVDMTIDRMLEALSAGEVDAVATWQPYGMRIRKSLGDKVVSFYGGEVFEQRFILVARQDYVRDNPGIVEEVLRDIVAAEHFLEENADEAQRIIADLVKLDRRLVGELWDDYSHDVRLSQSLVTALEAEARWAVGQGLAGGAKVPDYLALIRPEGLRAVSPEAVTVIE